jgi:hypothetical protein
MIVPVQVSVGEKTFPTAPLGNVNAVTLLRLSPPHITALDLSVIGSSASSSTFPHEKVNGIIIKNTTH